MQFGDLVAHWGDRVPCDWYADLPNHKPCRRPANWDVNLHGCYRGTVCGHHYWEWHRDNIGRTYCEDCDTRFPSFSDTFTARRL
ncbi:hypothetical protein ASE48_20160 [Mycobacterium sp. Root265]|nr:hypothetical protein ASE48_20160 [Mycobacterium sp. Root265]